MNVLELFAGVGGFRIGLENANPDYFRTLWSNQWEPSRKSQDAFEVYNYHFPDSENINISISDITDEQFSEMNADIIVGGFPCQDYSVARSKKNEQGIEGQKGVLFWEIIRATRIIRPRFLILENVDRLLKAPSKQRGRDFAIMLTAFNNLGYSVEWRVINAADYGRSQRRRRVFFFIYRNDIPFAHQMDQRFEEQELVFDENRYDDYIFHEGLFATQFPIMNTPVKKRHVYYELPEDIVEVSDNFSGTVWNTGVMRHGKYYSIDTAPNYDGEPITLGEILQNEEEVPEKFFITDPAKLEKFQYLRGPKRIERTSADGHTYIYSEGGMSPTDDLNLPGRTMLTSEGTVNRSTHFLNVNGRYRLITPVEAERLQDFPDNWTALKRLSDGTITKVSDKMRMFFMGNALVTDIVRKIGEFIVEIDIAE
ncbi:DNA cytosine methyltransferase [Streptococcus thermophilus]|uniref:DNA cytosine methyltransferase n=1 Tax=Streptococcus thermophilus TaxID=1308 RepID=UPI0022F126DF|nr:DNA (cytosine-5-)-methyltransferase [Streptococcus thermophilus]MCE2068069.1 DNA (cytosine-5-)-methyltransferase [Streptococcus thermophilus]MCE2075263.1 DNA (cytosine-5-)-methyltransferase [Streptococcus thermophilus]MCE2105175.1 DNA (cytosine-5-)-methyltransferase [Streptococcus thermophilus]MDA3719776.1 DNA (cytosine-5-)-methyltransferase [Streptococcus thermophilus]MDA3769749.1 DNA (cytosine-5-)-methyltransferase [Streptococcus thermophilus]